MDKIRHNYNRGLTHPGNIKDPIMKRVMESHRDAVKKLQTKAVEDEKIFKEIRNAKQPKPLQLVAGDNIRLRDLGDNKIKIYASGTNEVAQTTGDSSAYVGPFAVIQKEDTDDYVTVCPGSDINNTYYGRIQLGLSYVVLAETDVFVNASNYISANITYTDSAYAVAIGQGYGGGDSTIYVPLAYVKCVNSKITEIVQIQYGSIYFDGRVL